MHMRLGGLAICGLQRLSRGRALTLWNTPSTRLAQCGTARQSTAAVFPCSMPFKATSSLLSIFITNYLMKNVEKYRISDDKYNFGNTSFCVPRLRCI